MFLFESFTYNSDWAVKYYEDFYNASEYFANYLNKDYKDINKGSFFVRRCWDKDHKNNIYEITYLNKSDIFDNLFPIDAYKYAYNKINSYDNQAISIISAQDPDNIDRNKLLKIVFKYDISKDEVRWNEEHDNINAGMTYGLIVDSKPTLETWLYMLKAYSQRKSPDKRLFSKKNGLKDVCAKYIVAVKMGWDDAEFVLMSIISEILATDQYRDSIPSPFKKWLDAYANFMYEPDEDIQELANDYKDYSKNVSKLSIPYRIMHICRVLDNNSKVKKYEVVNGYYYAINVLLTNDQAGRIYLDNYTSSAIKSEEEFYTVSVATHKQHCEKRTAAIKLRYIDKEIDSAVNAIYYDDPEELGKITIKI